MELFDKKDLKERVSVLNEWLNDHGEEHFHYLVVKAERDLYRHRLEVLEETEIPAIEARTVSNCYSMILKGKL